MCMLAGFGKHKSVGNECGRAATHVPGALLLKCQRHCYGSSCGCHSTHGKMGYATVCQSALSLGCVPLLLCTACHGCLWSLLQSCTRLLATA